jgi:hypothetical protein
MKFSHSIQFNAVPDWSTHYIAYSNLKKLYVLFCFTALCPCGVVSEGGNGVLTGRDLESISSRRTSTRAEAVMESRGP